MRHANLKPGIKAVRGFSHVEVLVATVLIAMALVPAMESLHTGLKSAEVFQHRLVAHYHLKAMMETLMARPYAELDAAALLAGSESTPVADYSDSIGSENRRLVYLSRYDGDDADNDANPFTGKDAGLLWLRVEIEAETGLGFENLRLE